VNATPSESQKETQSVPTDIPLPLRLYLSPTLFLCPPPLATFPSGNHKLSCRCGSCWKLKTHFSSWQLHLATWETLLPLPLSPFFLFFLPLLAQLILSFIPFHFSLQPLLFAPFFLAICQPFYCIIDLATEKPPPWLLPLCSTSLVSLTTPLVLLTIRLKSLAN